VVIDSLASNSQFVDSALILAATFFIVFALNVAPAFAPPTWTVLSFIAIKYNVSVPALAIVGATAATLGRVVLARFSNVVIRQRFLSPSTRANIDHIRAKIESKKTLTSGLFLVYALSPFPSNHLFIAYGLTSMAVRLVAVPFFLGRVVGYSLWGFTASGAARLLGYDSLRSGRFFSYYFVLAQCITLVTIYAFAKIDWRILFAEKKLRWVGSNPKAVPNCGEGKNG
jgi:hypothetical protein